MSFFILILALLLSTVVRVTDSCSSFTGWKFRKAADVPQKEHKIEVEVTGKTNNIDQIENKNISANKMYKPITVPIILAAGMSYERCERELEKIYCNKRGKCILIEDYNENAELEKKGHCICNLGYTGERCMEKSPDHYYLTLIEEDRKMREILTQTSSSTTEATTVRSSTSKELGEKMPCPSPWNEDFCINGECYILPDLSNTDYFCTCPDGYTGTRCHEKIADFHYETVIRDRRHIPDVRRRKYLSNHKFRTKT